MQGKIQIHETNIPHYQKFTSSKRQNSVPSDVISLNRISEMLTSEGNETFRNYIEWLGLSSDPKLVVLSSIHHYYYDAEEMQNVKTVVNLKELNQIKDLRNFLHSMFLILPPKCYLIGCFVDNKKQSVFSLKKRSTSAHPNINSENEKNGIVSEIPFFNTVFSILDARTNNYHSVKNVSKLLENNGFKVLDMTEQDGLTYFCSQNLRMADN